MNAVVQSMASKVLLLLSLILWQPICLCSSIQASCSSKQCCPVDSHCAEASDAHAHDDSKPDEKHPDPSDKNHGLCECVTPFVAISTHAASLASLLDLFSDFSYGVTLLESEILFPDNNFVPLVNQLGGERPPPLPLYRTYCIIRC